MDNPIIEGGVTVETVDDHFVVHVVENGVTNAHDFPTEDLAEDFAHSQRMRLGHIPQPDLA